MEHSLTICLILSSADKELITPIVRYTEVKSKKAPIIFAPAKRYVLNFLRFSFEDLKTVVETTSEILSEYKRNYVILKESG